MIRALVMKELRETWVFAAITLTILVAATFLSGMDYWYWLTRDIRPLPLQRSPFVTGGIVDFFSVCWGALVLLLAVRQSAWDGRGRWLFLLHRPLSRNAIFLTKMGTGLAVYAVVSAIPVLILAQWSANPENVAESFEWWMLRDACRMFAAMAVLYCGVFLIGTRSHLALTAIFPLIALLMIMAVLAAPAWKWYVWFPASAGLAAILAANVCYTARTRNYS